MKTRQLFPTGHILEERVFTVSEFLDFLNAILVPNRVIVRGEVGEKVGAYPQYVYFNLLDKQNLSPLAKGEGQNSILKCFAWKNVVELIGIEFKAGMDIKVIGYPEIRKNRGEFRFQVQRIELLGEGDLKKQFEVLKKKLAALGYFDLKFKKPIPRFCENIGLITSKYGKGAKKDFLTHLGNFGLNIFFYDARVEGSLALYEIQERIRWFNQNFPEIDALVLIRGGGDWESLQPFNSQELVKTIFASKIPIITGIGHEDDTTLADLVADKKASTPTHAAKILTEGWEYASKSIVEFEKNLNVSIKNIFKQFEVLEKEFKNNIRKIKILNNNERLKIEQFLEALNKNKNLWLEKLSILLIQQEEKLILSSPNLKLKQGYTITKDEGGRIIKDAEKLKIAQKINTKFHKGQVLSEVRKIIK